jgi:phage shock protein C
MKQLVRPREGRMIAGACAAVANRFGVNVVAVRLLTLLAMVFFGLSLWVYIALWILIPAED